MKRIFCQLLTITACILFIAGCSSRFMANRGCYDATDLALSSSDDVSPDRHKGSFAPETLVMMGDGSFKKIVYVRVGDIVRSFDIKSDSFMNTEVIRIRNGFAGYYYAVNGHLHVTPPHPFRTPDNKWMKIDDLKEGQSVRIITGIRKIASVEYRLESQRIYNIYVKENHNFFVSGDGRDFFLVKEWK